MPTLAHIINLFHPTESSDLKQAQEVSIASMICAKHAAKNPESIQLFSAQTRADRTVIPSEFLATDLTRDVTDLHPFSKKMNLPILKGILYELYRESDAEYLIHSNVDIGGTATVI